MPFLVKLMVENENVLGDCWKMFHMEHWNFELLYVVLIRLIGNECCEKHLDHTHTWPEWVTKSNDNTIPSLLSVCYLHILQ